MFNYLKNSIKRKIARRITKEYPPLVSTYDLGKYGSFEFANWSNPLIEKIPLSADTVEFYKQFIKEGDLAIDIGANIGDTTVPMAICTGSNGLTIGFDPNPYTNKILQANAGLNGGRYKIVPVNAAISDKKGEFYFISSEASFGNGEISVTKDNPHNKFVHSDKIRGVNLIEFLENDYPQWLNKLSLIKIDTEGYDKEIIKSITGLILKYKPYLIAESFGKSANADKLELFDVIAKNNYEIYYFADFDITAEVKKLEKNTDILQYSNTINIYAKPHG